MSALKLPPFEYHEPTTVAEVTALLGEYGEEARVLAGGVDLLPRMRAGTVRAGHVVNIRRVSGLEYARRVETGGLEFGAMATLHSLEKWPVLSAGYPALYSAIHQITSVQTKCMGTAVGNLCVATPASDVAPALAAYDAELLVSGPEGEREIAMTDFYPDYGRTALRRGELVIGVKLPPVSPGQGAAFLNLVRTHADIAKVTVTVCVRIEDDLCKEARIALGSVAPTMVRARQAEAVLEGERLTDGLMWQAAATASGEIRPITDLRSTAEYRKEMVRVLVARALKQATEHAKGKREVAP